MASSPHLFGSSVLDIARRDDEHRTYPIRYPQRSGVALPIVEHRRRRVTQFVDEIREPIGGRSLSHMTTQFAIWAAPSHTSYAQPNRHRPPRAAAARDRGIDVAGIDRYPNCGGDGGSFRGRTPRRHEPGCAAVSVRASEGVRLAPRPTEVACHWPPPAGVTTRGALSASAMPLRLVTPPACSVLITEAALLSQLRALSGRRGEPVVMVPSARPSW
jgi:hypothetical protein